MRSKDCCRSNRLCIVFLDIDKQIVTVSPAAGVNTGRRSNCGGRAMELVSCVVSEAAGGFVGEVRVLLGRLR